MYARGEPEAVLARRLLDAEAERTRAFEVVSATELHRLAADPQAWFGLEAAPGYAFADGARPPLLRAARARGASGYLLEGRDAAVGFVAWGRGLRAGVRVPRMHQIDIAPTVAALLGLPLEGATGRPLVGVLTRHPRPMGAAAVTGYGVP